MTSDTFGAIFYDDVVSKGENDFGAVFYQPQEKKTEEEGFLKSATRYGAQIPLGIAQATPPGIISNLMQMMGVGSALDEEELQQLRKIHEREGKEFDEEAYMRSLQEASDLFPTPSNIARMTEEATGLPLTPKTRGQEFVQFAATAAKAIPKGGTPSAPLGTTFRGMNTALPRPILGTGVSGARELLKEVVPQPVADIASFAVLKKPIAGAGSLSIGKETKPSGLTKRGFENVKQPRTVSEKKIQQINTKLEKDFKDISDKIIKDSPIGETANNLKNDPTFKQESRELLNQAQEIADQITETLPSKSLKKELADTAAKKVKGYALGEYDKSYMKYMKEALDDIVPENIKAGELVEQYRKNNASLSEYFEPGSSKALNRAKRDAILDQNRAIAKVMESSFPESELAPVFKQGNERWSKIKNAEEIDNFVNDIFPENKRIDFKQAREFFDDPNYQRIFKNSLGEKGYTDFEQVMKDMLTSEVPYKMLKVGQQKGFFQHMGEMATAFFIHPHLAKAKGIYDLSKYAYRSLINSMLDKPQIGIQFNKGIKDLKKGDFKAAEKELEAVQAEVLPKEETPKTAKQPETFEANVEKIPERKLLKGPEIEEKVSSFKTEKGSEYKINEDGTTTRNKEYRPEHGEKEQGLQPKSEKTWFVTPEDANKLSEIQTSGQSKRIIELPDGRLGIMYEQGKDAGKVEARTVITPKTEPEKGLLPLESWDGGKKVHFGNKITEISSKEPKRLEAPKKQIEHKEPEKPTQKLESKKINIESKEYEVPEEFQSQPNYEPPIKRKKESKLQREFREYQEAKESKSKKDLDKPVNRNIADFKRKAKSNNPLYPKKMMEEAIEREKAKKEPKEKEYIFGSNNKVPKTSEIKILEKRLEKEYDKLLKMDDKFRQESRSKKPINPKKRSIDIKLKDEQQRRVDLLRDELSNEEIHEIEMYKLKNDIKNMKKIK